MRESKVCKNPKCQKIFYRDECKEKVIQYQNKWDEIKYCTPQCMRRFVSNENRKRNHVGANLRSFEEIKDQNKVCLICDKTIWRKDCNERAQKFDNHWDLIKYCSDICRRVSVEKNKKHNKINKDFEVAPDEKKCKECGEIFKRSEQTIKICSSDRKWTSKQFCSQHCAWCFSSKNTERRMWLNKRIKLERELELQGIDKIKICEFCERKFERIDQRAQEWLDQKYCSVSCRYKAFYERNLPDDATRKEFRFQNRVLDLVNNILKEECEQEKTFDWLKNPKTGYKLRCDGYYKKYNLVIEVQGEQHYNPNCSFLKEYKYDFEESQYRDRIKREQLVKNGVKLIEVRQDEVLNEDLIRGKLVGVGITI